MMEFKQTRLDNGLTIIAEVNPSADTMAASFFVRTGSRDETPDVSGVSHFLEHMVFKGTPRRTALDVNREFDELGAEYNASTSSENTIFYGSVLPEYQGRLLDILCDIMRPSLRQKDFDTEKKVILEEIALYEDQPKFRTFESLMAEFFAEHPLGNLVAGTAESIKAMKRDAMQAYFDRRYSPGNVSLVGVGNLDFAALTESAQRLCSSWRAFETHRDTPATPHTAVRKVLVDAKLTRQQVGLMSPAPSFQDDARHAAELLSTIMGDSTGSRLYYALVDPAIVDEAGMYYEPFDGAGGFLTFLSADPDRAAQALEIATAELKRFQQEGPTEQELQAAKNKIASGATLKGELPMGRLGPIGMDWEYRHEYVPLDKQIEALFAVTRSQIIELARGYDLARATMLTLGPKENL